MPFTFSNKKAFGVLSFKILATSKNKVPRVSSKPNLRPPIENGWQGNPAHKISKSGISLDEILVISPLGFSKKFEKYVSQAHLSISELKTHFALHAVLLTKTVLTVVRKPQGT